MVTSETAKPAADTRLLLPLSITSALTNRVIDKTIGYRYHCYSMGAEGDPITVYQVFQLVETGVALLMGSGGVFALFRLRSAMQDKTYPHADTETWNNSNYHPDSKTRVILHGVAQGNSFQEANEVYDKVENLHVGKRLLREEKQPLLLAKNPPREKKKKGNNKGSLFGNGETYIEQIVTTEHGRIRTVTVRDRWGREATTIEFLEN